MAITIIGGYTSYAFSASGNLSIGSGVTQVGDMLIAHISSADNVDFTPPAGWTPIYETNNGTGLRLSIYWFRATGNHQFDTITWTRTGGSRTIGRIIVLRGCIASGDPINTSNISVNASDASIEFSSITTTANNCMILALDAIIPGELSGYTGFNATLNILYSFQDPINYNNMVCMYGIKESAGSTGSGVRLSSYSGPSIGSFIAINNEPTPPTAPTLLTATCSVGIGESTLPDAPGTSFTADVYSGLAPLTVQFTDRSSGTPTSWLWEFGDGTTSTAQNPSHVFTASGIYPVRLTATNAQGSNQYQATIMATTAPVVTPPADGTVIPVEGPPGSTIDSIYGKIAYYAVDRAGNQVHIYGQTGSLLKTFGGVGTAIGKFYLPTTCSVIGGRQLIDRIVIDEE